MIFGKIMASMLLVKWPVLFVCVGLEAEESEIQKKNMTHDRFIGGEP